MEALENKDLNTLWLVKKTNIPYSYISSDDLVVLIEDGVLKVPTKENWYLCKEDAEVRGIKPPVGKSLSYEEIAELIIKAKKVVVW